MKIFICIVCFCVMAIGVAMGGAQPQKIISRFPNVPRIVRLWNSIAPCTIEYNKAMKLAEASLRTFKPGLVVDEAERARRVGYYKTALQASTVCEGDALRGLIDEEGVDE